VAEELVDQDLNPHRGPQQTLGNQLGYRWNGEGPRTVFTGAGPLITSPPNPPPIGPEIDLDLFGILGVAGRQRRPAPGANALVLGQFAEILDDWEMTIVPPSWAAITGLLPPLPRGGGVLIAILAFKVIGAILGRRLLALATEELILELAILAAELFDFGFEFPLAFDRPRVHRLPIADLLAEIEVVESQSYDFLAEFANFATKLEHQIGQISQLGSWKWINKRVVHD
jgi:hypothetical protein